MYTLSINYLILSVTLRGAYTISISCFTDKVTGQVTAEGHTTNKWWRQYLYGSNFRVSTLKATTLKKNYNRVYYSVKPISLLN